MTTATTEPTEAIQHADAYGHLQDLANDINQSWFNLICELGVGNNSKSLKDIELDYIFRIFVGHASHFKITNASASGQTTPSTVITPDYLETIHDFKDFKNLQSSLKVKLHRRLNLIFGNNGSGKSSLCETLKILASKETPTRPVANVHSEGRPSFSFKLANVPQAETWATSTGFGTKSDKIKYFDTSIAIKNIMDSVEPGRVVELSPFKLHIFDLVRSYVTQLRDKATEHQKQNKSSLEQVLANLEKTFSGFTDKPILKVTSANLSLLPEIIKQAESLISEEDLTAKGNALAELEKASSEDGLKNLQTEHRDIEALSTLLTGLFSNMEKIKNTDIPSKRKLLTEKQTAQNAIAQALIPRGSTLEKLLLLLKAANQMSPLAESASCGLCKQNLGVSELELFQKYHQVLNGELEGEIAALKKEITVGETAVQAVKSTNLKSLDASMALPGEELHSVAKKLNLIITHFNTSETLSDITEEIDALKLAQSKWREIKEVKRIAIESAQNGRTDLLKKIATQKNELKDLLYQKSLNQELSMLRKLETHGKIDAFWAPKIPPFSTLLRKITDKEKAAHDALVVSDFSTRLDQEYSALAEKSMSAFKVALTKRGTATGFTVTPKIGGKELSTVMSEGEQRIHALALFFAELGTCSQSVIVFDDPISSFDYNYIANYCIRIRDYSLKYPEKQLIILTHSWEFFVQLQLTLKNTSLDNFKSIQVIENCSLIEDYSDKPDDLKREIKGILDRATEPSKTEKEQMAGRMRRLIEVVVNTQVFANQRHQFKQKSQKVSDFQSFTQVTPLVESEALALKDLYSKLSITEHDDPRTAYVNTDKAAFQTRYDAILNIESSIKARK